MDVSFISERITELRLARNISEYQMSLELGKSKSYIQGITSKKSLLLRSSSLFEICDHLGVSLRNFLTPAITILPCSVTLSTSCVSLILPICS